MIHVAQLLQSRRRLVLRLEQVFLLLLRALLGHGDARLGLLLLQLNGGLLTLVEHLQQSVGRQAVDDIGGKTADAAAASVADASRQGRYDRRPEF